MPCVVAMDSVVSHEYTLRFLREDLLNESMKWPSFLSKLPYFLE